MKNSFILVPSTATSLFLRYLLKYNLYELYFEGVMSNDYTGKERNFKAYHPISNPMEFVNLAFPWENVSVANRSWSTINNNWKNCYRDKDSAILKYFKRNIGKLKIKK